jgi:hypothetical protein
MWFFVAAIVIVLVVNFIRKEIKKAKVKEETEELATEKLRERKLIPVKVMDTIKTANDSSIFDTLVGLVILGLVIYAYVENIQPAFIQMNKWYGKLNSSFSERSIQEIFKNRSDETNTREMSSKTIKWSTKKRYWTSDNKEIRYDFKTSYFNNNLLYIITVEPYDDRFSNNRSVTINVDNNDGFTLFSINARSWERYSDDGNNQIGFIANGRIQMTEEDYNYLLVHKNRLDWKITIP